MRPNPALSASDVVEPARARGQLPPLPTDVDALTAEGALEVALATLGSDRVALCASFGPEDVVILDMLVRFNPRARVFTIDTGRLPQETFDLIDRIRDRYAIAVEVYTPDPPATEAMVTANGPNLFYRSKVLRLECCDVRKVQPLRRALATVDGWITGIRRDQIASRAGTPKIGLDLAHGMIWKVAPLAEWTDAQVWGYVREHDLPYNALHDRGYPSIGCAPCTRAVEPGADPRSGRWWWEGEDGRECGMHVSQGTLEQRQDAG